jgi:hypothetical protein
MNIQFNELPYPAAYRAASGYSQDPDGRARREIAEFAEYCRGIIARFERYETEANSEELAADVQRYLDGYRAKYLAMLAADARHVSPFIVGPSNYPVRQMEKRLATADRRRAELNEYAEKAPARLLRKYSPTAPGAIDSGDGDALDRLQAQLSKAEALQVTMKAANAIIRKRVSDEEKVAALVAIDGISEKTARELLTPSCNGDLGFEPFQLSNNAANIRRLKQRIASVGRLQSAAGVAVTGDGFTISEDADANRLRIEFDGKPAEEVRGWLKAHAFNWSRTNGAWQRKITANARAVAREFAAWMEARE